MAAEPDHQQHDQAGGTPVAKAAVASKAASRAAAKPASKAAAKTNGKSGSRSAVKLQPLHDRIVIRPVVQEEVLASGLVIPDTAKEKPQQGEVIAVGPGRLDDNGKRVAMDVQVGDRVLYAKYTGQEVKLDQEEIIVLSEKDILAKLV
ncbi:MAG: co-chaperone GroES [Chloroflexi bacterium]|nr:co-chaperone GroES [Chloroflexota bacterium]